MCLAMLNKLMEYCGRRFYERTPMESSAYIDPPTSAAMPGCACTLSENRPVHPPV
jgi:hypothetical protein